jgi:prepilin-type N-terminal cleavage/methylation domain-containing protein
MKGLLEYAKREEGFSLIELLVVILIIGVLAGIAIPSFLIQQGKADDATAKELARAAAQAAETYETDHSGTYTGLTRAALHELDGSLYLAASGNNAYLKSAAEFEGAKGYVVTAEAPSSKDTFTITRTSTGEMKRTCEASASTNSDCRTGTW